MYYSPYHCRRWSGNSDAALSLESVNRNNYDKDEIRSLEIQARQIFNLLMSMDDADFEGVDFDDANFDADNED